MRGVIIRMSVLALLMILVNGQSCETGSVKEETIWNIAVGHASGATEYIDDAGYLSGFFFDLIREVCAIGGMQCRTIWDKYSNCWKSEPGQHSYGGEGLMNGYYDACTGWMSTINRLQVFDFSLPFMKARGAYFYIKKGSRFNPDDISSVNMIGFMDGWVSDEKCLARQTQITGSLLPQNKIRYYPSIEALQNALRDGEIEAIFLVDHFIDMDEAVSAGPEIICAAAGQAMMTRKDNDFNSHWNGAFQQFVSSGGFQKLCAEAKEKHGHIGDLNPCV